MSKICSVCKGIKENNEFFKDKRARDELYSRCKKCHFQKMKKYKKSEYYRNIENYRKNAKKYYEKNRERILVNSKNYYQCNREIILPKNKIFSANYRKNNPAKYAFYTRQRTYRIKGAKGSHTKEQWENLKSFFKYCCLCCRKQEPKIKLTQDHIIPISKNGTNYIENIQPLCNSCNSSKKGKIINYIFTGYGEQAHQTAIQNGIQKKNVKIIN